MEIVLSRTNLHALFVKVRWFLFTLLRFVAFVDVGSSMLECVRSRVGVRRRYVVKITSQP